MIELTNKESRKLKSVKMLDDPYDFKPGDRVFISEHVDMKLREADKYFKANFTDVKRATYMKDANKIIDADNNKLKPCLIDIENKWRIDINGEIEYCNNEYNGIWNVKISKKLMAILTDDKYQIHFGGDGWIDAKELSKFTNIVQSVLGLKVASTVSAKDNDVVNNLLTVPIYDCTKLLKNVKEYNYSLRENCEDVEIDSIIDLISTKSTTNTNLALKIMNSFDMRPYYSELVCMFFSGKMDNQSQSLLGKYFRKDTIFQNFYIPNSNNKDSDIMRSGFKYFKATLTVLKELNLPINREFIYNKMFES